MGQASTVKDLGDLSTEMVHIESGERIHTDAPKDNAGKGEGFSPTDLVATSLASCMITTMGIKARQHEIDLVGTHADVVKEMSANPRRISAIRINIYFPHNYNNKNKKILKHIAHACPVGRSLHIDIEEDITFHYPD